MASRMFLWALSEFKPRTMSATRLVTRLIHVRRFPVDPTVQALYDLALGTYVGVIWLLVSEMMVWKTVHVKDIIVPFAVTAVGLGWMARQREWYVG